ncbi:hypothetical protein [Streptomyces sp. NRRL WC-3742]|uniref:hypothetical protein n=1 Tax=Streptomyces sp. NRRL WC-3742 TaxID=1463934 RepID=UPI0004C5E63B|nr:hypothetical protein [Streptomyces sp. NRRL WC-3742]
MTIDDAVPAQPRVTLPPCPNCGLADALRGVPAVHLAEHRTVRVRVRGERGRPDHTETREELSALGRALAPKPQRPSIPVTLLAFVGVPGTIAAIFTLVQGTIARSTPVMEKPDLSPPDWVTHPAPGNGPFWPPSSHEPTPHVPGPVRYEEGIVPLWASILFIVAAVALLVAAGVLHRSRQRRLADGWPMAERLWRQSWYCDRCGSVHFAASAGQGTQALSLPEFRLAVWSAGGYGDLAGRHQV